MGGVNFINQGKETEGSAGNGQEGKNEIAWSKIKDSSIPTNLETSGETANFSDILGKRDVLGARDKILREIKKDKSLKSDDNQNSAKKGFWSLLFGSHQEEARNKDSGKPMIIQPAARRKSPEEPAKPEKEIIRQRLAERMQTPRTEDRKPADLAPAIKKEPPKHEILPPISATGWLDRFLGISRQTSSQRPSPLPAEKPAIKAAVPTPILAQREKADLKTDLLHSLEAAKEPEKPEKAEKLFKTDLLKPLSEGYRETIMNDEPTKPNKIEQERSESRPKETLSKEQPARKQFVPRTISSNLIKEEAVFYVNWKKDLMIILFFALFAAGVVMFGIMLTDQELNIKGKEKESNDLDAKIQEINSRIGKLKDKQAEAAKTREKLSAVGYLLDGHIYWTDFFAWLEANTIAGASYGEFSGDISGHYKLEGKLPDYAYLTEYLKSLNESETVVSAACQRAVLGRDGLGFSIDLAIDPEIFHKK